MKPDPVLNRRALLTTAGALLICTAPPLIASSHAAQPTLPLLSNIFGGPFSLIDQDGHPRTDRDFRGKYMLIFFGYTFCPTICPVNLQHGADAMAALGNKADQVVPIFISIDPARDTPRVLKDYLANFGRRYIGLTGSEQQIAKVAKAYRIHRRKVLPEGTASKNDYLVDHSSITYLMGPDGKFITLFPHNTPGAVMARRITRYLAS